MEAALAPQPSPKVKSPAPPPSRPSRATGVIKPHPAVARLDVALGAAPAAPSVADGPRTVPPSRTPTAQPVKPPLKPTPVLLRPSRIARAPEGELIAVPRSPTLADVPPLTPPAARPKPSPLMARKPALPQPVLVPTRLAPGGAASRPSEVRKPDGLQRGSTPDRIVLPVYRLARLPERLSNRRSYTVRRGDTLRRIATQHGVTPRSILVANGLMGPAEVTPGRRLSIPGMITIAYNDQPVGFDVQPRVEKGMAIAPFRQIFEHTGGVVSYEPADRLVSATNPEKEIRIKIGSREALVNSAVVLMDRAAFLDSGRTMVPVKFMTEALDLKAEYDLKTGAIYLSRK